MTSAESKILFAGRGGLWTVRGDGTGHKCLSEREEWRLWDGPLRDAAWSPDGKQIVLSFYGYVRVAGALERRWMVAVADADGSIAVDPLVRADARMPHHASCPAWSPDSQSIVFVGSLGSQSITPSGLWSMRADGTGLRPLLDIGLLLREPMSSPDGSRIAFLATCYENELLSCVLPRGVDHGIYLHVANADGSEQRRLSRVHGCFGCRTVSWSPDGQHIAFAVDCELHIINADGTGRVQLTESSGHVESPWDEGGGYRQNVQVCDGGPAWSPDGSRIAFVSNRTGCGQIYTIAPDGTQLKQLTHEPGGDHGPCWSRDGRCIAFVSMRGFERRPSYNTDNTVWVMEADGSNQLCVSREQRPCDAPDIF